MTELTREQQIKLAVDEIKQVVYDRYGKDNVVWQEQSGRFIIHCLSTESALEKIHYLMAWEAQTQSVEEVRFNAEGITIVLLQPDGYVPEAQSVIVTPKPAELILPPEPTSA